MAFNEKYFKILNIVQKYIDKIDLTSEISIQEPLKTKVVEILNAPSKHIRPLVSFLLLKAIGAEIDENQILYQTAIELVHNASLIHDDVIDESFERRNVQTVNQKFGNQTAVILGDYLLAVSMNKILQINIPELVNIFCETLKVMSLGEINQNLTKYKIPAIDEYIKKSEQKTAKLFETAILGAMIINGHSEQSKESSKDFAKNFGIAFQIRDDLINCITSKSDINEGIYTAPVIYSSGTTITGEGIEKTKILLNNYLDTAKESLKSIKDNEYKSALIELVELLRDE
jgi:geranylgeranyl pyrophosphate synthase